MKAVNLGWKLALVVRGRAPERLLDTYTAQRHPVAERVLRNTRAQVALMRPGPQVDALREVLGEVLEIPVVLQHFIAMANDTDVDYAPGSEHPSVGSRRRRTSPNCPARAAGCSWTGSVRPRCASSRRASPTGSGCTRPVPAPRARRPCWYARRLRRVASEGPDPTGLDAALAEWFGAPVPPWRADTWILTSAGGGSTGRSDASWEDTTMSIRVAGGRRTSRGRG